MIEKEIQELKKLGIDVDKFKKECYYLDHNIRNRKLKNEDDYEKEQNAIKQILKKPMIKGGQTLYKNLNTISNKNPYSDIE